MRTTIIAAAVIIAGALLSTSPDAAKSSVVAGPAKAIDGDTIIIRGIRIRIAGIDAPEKRQTCSNGVGKPWPCGAVATDTMARLIKGKKVRCLSQSRDRYKRLIATCHAGDVDLGRTMIRLGVAKRKLK